MRSGGPAYTVLAVDHIKHIDGEAVKAVVKSFSSALLPAEHGGLEAVAQTRRLLVGKSNSPQRPVFSVRKVFILSQLGSSPPAMRLLQ